MKLNVLFGYVTMVGCFYTLAIVSTPFFLITLAGLLWLGPAGEAEDEPTEPLTWWD